MTLQKWRPTSRLMRRSPFGALERQREDVFDRVLRRRPLRRLDTEYVGRVPPPDRVDRKNALLRRADLPALDRRDIRPSVENGVLPKTEEGKGKKIDVKAA